MVVCINDDQQKLLIHQIFDIVSIWLLPEFQTADEQSLDFTCLHTKLNISYNHNDDNSQNMSPRITSPYINMDLSENRLPL